MKIHSYTKGQKIRSDATENEVVEHYFEQRANTIADRKIYYFHQPTKLFPINKKELLKEIIKDMKLAMEGCGIGLAHNQLPQKDNIQNPYAICIIDFKSDVKEEEVPFEAFINPVVVGYSEEKTKFLHGCLSAIGYPRGNISTYSEILVAYYTPELDIIKVKKFSAMGAIILQHELRHVYSSDTYVDAALSFFNNDITRLKEYYRVSNTTESDKTNQTVGTSDINQIPCLITEEMLLQCKKFLQSNPIYNDAVENCLISHPEWQFLHNNLMQIKDGTLSLSPLYISGESCSDGEFSV